MKVEIYTKTGCPYCAATICWLDQNGLNYNETVLDSDEKRSKFYDKINASDEIKEHVRTVPQIFVNGKHIGGYTDLHSKSKEILKKR
jgi:glutaredoxin